MIRYEKCPRCDLNYIDPEKQEYCDVCLAELHGGKLQFADLDEDDYEELDAELGQEEICPICGVNPIRAGEKMCETCKSQQEFAEEEIDIEKDEEWKNYLDEEDDGNLEVDETLREELDAELEDDEDEDGEEFVDEDDFEDDFDDVGDDFGDEDDDDDDDDEEDDDDIF